MSTGGESSKSATAASVVKEIRNHAHNLKELQRRSRPWDADVEFQRQQIRRLQLQLLFKFPSARESREVDNQLWMSTSHSFISTYKALLAAMDREREIGSQSGNARGRPPRNVVEKRRLIQRFRQFLSAEDKFWRTFLIRYATFFSLDDTKALLLPIIGGEYDVTENASERNIFPSNISQEEQSSPKKMEREQRLAVVSKALVCLGDLTRYKEQQGDSTKNEYPNNSRGGRGRQTNVPSHIPNYSKSQSLYECARSLNPNIGNASHQLAIISNYQKDTFSAVYHYYRALCVRHPFETASENLHTVLNKALDAYVSKGDRNDEQINSSLSPKAQVEFLKEKVVLLHASFRLSPEDTLKNLSNIPSTLILDFSSLVSDRSLTPDVMTRILVMAIGALWRIRMIRDAKKDREREKDGRESVEPRVVVHLLGLMTSLLRIGILQVSDGADVQRREAGDSADLAMSITAVFRRVLPILRICSKWTRAHLSYLISLLPVNGSNVSKDISIAVSDFWIAYQAFFTNLGRAFPSNGVPELSNPLEEDVDMNGFVPLKKAMLSAFSKTANGLSISQSLVHPNEEHLMRISDLLRDAEAVATDEKSPIFMHDNKFTFKPPEPPKSNSPNTSHLETIPKTSSLDSSIMVPPSVKSHALLQRSAKASVSTTPAKEDDDDNATVSTRTEDDPVHLAMHAVEGLSSHDSDEMEEDEVLYPKQSINTPIKGFASISPRLAAITPTVPPIGTRRGSNPQMTTPRRLGFSPLPQSISDSKWTNAAQPPLLFGSGSGDAPSIWSTSHDPGISSNISAPHGQTLVTPTLSTATRSPIFGRAVPSSPAPVSTSWRSDQPFEVNSPSNFVSHGALRGSLSMPPYGFIQPPAVDTHPTYLQANRPLNPYHAMHPDYNQTTWQYRDWAPPP